MIICFDVDNTVIDTGLEFSKFASNLGFVQDHFNNMEDCLDFTHRTYDIRDYSFLSESERKILSDFWKCKFLYDNIDVTESSIITIKELKKLGFKVIFASHVEGNHAKSKFEMLKRSFGNIDGFIATREKQFVLCDYLIDDRLYNLTNLICSKPIYVKTRYKDDHTLLEKLEIPTVDFENLNNILDIIVS